MAISETNCHSL